MEDGPAWPATVIGNGLAFAYPFVTTLGTMGIGERFGARSSNRGSAYIFPSLACVPLAIAAGFVAIPLSKDTDDFDAFWRGVLWGVVPTAFLNAAVYNWVKKPETDTSSRPLRLSPCVSVYRSGHRHKDLTPLYGFSLSF